MSVVRTETQDGKSLLDAHFAHATALIKRYLKRVRDNEQSQVTSPSELVEALSALGGLQNCGTQLVLFDGSVEKKLKELCGNDQMAKASKKLKTYFGRCNELTYFPDEDRDDGKFFRVHAKGYSDVGAGGDFLVDLNDGTVRLQESESADKNNDTIAVEAASNDDSDDASIESYDEGEVREAFSTDGESESDVLDAFFLDTNAIDDPTTAAEEKRLQTSLGIDNYLPNNMVTGVLVVRFMALGEILSTTKAAQQKPRIERGIEMTGRMDVVSRGVRLLGAEAFSTFGVCDGIDESGVTEFLLAQNYQVPEQYKKTIGWARRPQRGMCLLEKVKPTCAYPF